MFYPANYGFIPTTRSEDGVLGHPAHRALPNRPQQP
ncbi:hypothetical protein [Pseudomonas aeruginosa]|nr:hypothetical protein [Pseudomonas aeruginosa]